MERTTPPSVINGDSYELLGPVLAYEFIFAIDSVPKTRNLLILLQSCLFFL